MELKSSQMNLTDSYLQACFEFWLWFTLIYINTVGYFLFLWKLLLPSSLMQQTLFKLLIIIRARQACRHKYELITENNGCSCLLFNFVIKKTKIFQMWEMAFYAKFFFCSIAYYYCSKQLQRSIRSLENCNTEWFFKRLFSQFSFLQTIAKIVP